MDHQTNTYPTPIGTVSWQGDDQTLAISFQNKGYKTEWREISRAGLVGFPETGSLPEIIIDTIPGTDETLDLLDQMRENYTQLVIARGWSTTRVIQIPYPLEDPIAALLVNTLKSRLGERWIGEVPVEGHEEALGIGMPRWYMAMILLGFILIAYLILQVISAAGALLSGEVYEVPGLVWLMLILLGMIFVYWIYQSRFQR